MIRSLGEVLSGERINLHGDVDIQMIMAGDNKPRVVLFQSEDGSSAPDDAVALDAHQVAHLARVLAAMIRHGGNLNDHVAAPRRGGV